jgi:hypothetical protein
MVDKVVQDVLGVPPQGGKDKGGRPQILPLGPAPLPFFFGPTPQKDSTTKQDSDRPQIVPVSDEAEASDKEDATEAVPRLEIRHKERGEISHKQGGTLPLQRVEISHKDGDQRVEVSHKEVATQSDPVEEVEIGTQPAQEKPAQAPGFANNWRNHRPFEERRDESRMKKRPVEEDPTDADDDAAPPRKRPRADKPGVKVVERPAIVPAPKRRPQP